MHFLIKEDTGNKVTSEMRVCEFDEKQFKVNNILSLKRLQLNNLNQNAFIYLLNNY